MAKKSIDETINTLQDQIMDLSHEVVEKNLRETYIDTMSEIIRCLMVDLKRSSKESLYGDKLRDSYKIESKEQEMLKEAFKKCFNDSFNELWDK
tara:strand:+ start:370 stop:651 length:282 start_codon:yes stop_codon:yes gene_type:complete